MESKQNINVDILKSLSLKALGIFALVGYLWEGRVPYYQAQVDQCVTLGSWLYNLMGAQNVPFLMHTCDKKKTNSKKKIILRTGFSSFLIDYPLLTVSFCFCLYSPKRLNVAFSILQSASEIIAAHLEVITHM